MAISACRICGYRFQFIPPVNEYECVRNSKSPSAELHAMPSSSLWAHRRRCRMRPRQIFINAENERRTTAAPLTILIIYHTQLVCRSPFATIHHHHRCPPTESTPTPMSLATMAIFGRSLHQIEARKLRDGFSFSQQNPISHTEHSAWISRHAPTNGKKWCEACDAQRIIINIF